MLDVPAIEESIKLVAPALNTVPQGFSSPWAGRISLRLLV
jgi:hypothetical protein